MPPCVLDFHEGSKTVEEPNGETVATVSLIIELKPDAQGRLKGRAYGEFSVSGVVEEGDCSFAWGTGARVEIELEAEGSGDGPYSIRTPQPQRVYEVQRHYLCDQAVDLTIGWQVLFEGDGVVFENRKWEGESEGSRTVLVYKDPDE